MAGELGAADLAGGEEVGALVAFLRVGGGSSAGVGYRGARYGVLGGVVVERDGDWGWEEVGEKGVCGDGGGGGRVERGGGWVVGVWVRVDIDAGQTVILGCNYLLHVCNGVRLVVLLSRVVSRWLEGLVAVVRSRWLEESCCGQCLNLWRWVLLRTGQLGDYSTGIVLNSWRGVCCLGERGVDD